MNTAELGIYGENLAVTYLIKKGYHIIERNYRFKKNEVDIICLDNEILVIVEVKTRQTAEIGEPWRAVTKQKQKQIIQVANFYLQSKEIDRNTRFDIVSIVHNSYRTDLEHIIDAFYPLV
jgi:putative endonuclease